MSLIASHPLPKSMSLYKELGSTVNRLNILDYRCSRQMLTYLKDWSRVFYLLVLSTYLMLNRSIFTISLPTLLVFACILGITTPKGSYAQTPAEEPPSVETPQEPEFETPQETEETTDDPNDPSNLRPLSQDNSLLSLQGAERLMDEASEAIGQENYDLAVSKLQQARKIFNQLSNFHLQLANSFSGIDTQVYEAQRESALATGQMRDSATYQLALVHRAQNQPELAVPLLIQIIRSQNPTTDLGQKSYQQLYELGFVDVPLSGEDTSASPPQN